MREECQQVCKWTRQAVDLLVQPDEGIVRMTTTRLTKRDDRVRPNPKTTGLGSILGNVSIMLGYKTDRRKGYLCWLLKARSSTNLQSWGVVWLSGQHCRCGRILPVTFCACLLKLEWQVLWASSRY